MGKGAVYFTHLPNRNEIVFKRSKINGAIQTLLGMQQEVIKYKITLFRDCCHDIQKALTIIIDYEYSAGWLIVCGFFFLVSKCNDNIKQLLIMSHSCFPSAWLKGFLNCRNNNKCIKAQGIPLCSLALHLSSYSIAEGFIITNERKHIISKLYYGKYHGAYLTLIRSMRLSKQSN